MFHNVASSILFVQGPVHRAGHQQFPGPAGISAVHPAPALSDAGPAGWIITYYRQMNGLEPNAMLVAGNRQVVHPALLPCTAISIRAIRQTALPNSVLTTCTTIRHRRPLFRHHRKIHMPAEGVSPRSPSVSGTRPSGTTGPGVPASLAERRQKPRIQPLSQDTEQHLFADPHVRIPRNIRLMAFWMSFSVAEIPFFLEQTVAANTGHIRELNQTIRVASD